MQITLVGAGSLEFCGPLLRSLLPVAKRYEATITLCDKDPTAIGEMTAIARRLASDLGQPKAVTVEGETSMTAAVADAQFVILTLNNGGHEADQRDYQNALDHGLLSNHIDTIGPAAWLRALRQGELCHELLSAMRPDATLLNLSNPLAFIGRMAVRAERDYVGFCHGPMSRVRTIADWLGIESMPEFTVFGTNHLSWLTELSVDGESLFPRLLQYLASDDATGDWRLNHELFEAHGMMPVLEGQHTADFFRGLNHRAALHAFGLETWDPHRQTKRLRVRLERRAALASGALDIAELPPSTEGVERVLDALSGGEAECGVYNAALKRRTNGLPQGSIAEGWMNIDQDGCHFIKPPELPEELCEQLERVAKQQDYAAQACEDADPGKLIDAIMMEPNLYRPEVANTMVERALADHAALLGERWPVPAPEGEPEAVAD